MMSGKVRIILSKAPRWIGRLIRRWLFIASVIVIILLIDTFVGLDIRITF